jgi:hypothetical protein
VVVFPQIKTFFSDSLVSIFFLTDKSIFGLVIFFNIMFSKIHVQII